MLDIINTQAEKILILEGKNKELESELKLISEEYSKSNMKILEISSIVPNLNEECTCANMTALKYIETILNNE